MSMLWNLDDRRERVIEAHRHAHGAHLAHVSLKRFHAGEPLDAVAIALFNGAAWYEHAGWALDEPEAHRGARLVDHVKEAGLAVDGLHARLRP